MSALTLAEEAGRIERRIKDLQAEHEEATIEELLLILSRSILLVGASITRELARIGGKR